MRSQKSWNQVVAGVERSGLTLQKEMQMLNHQRQQKLQQQLVDQMSEALRRKNQQQRRKKYQRQQAESQTRKVMEKERKSRLQYRQRQQIFRRENLKILNEKGRSDPKYHEKQHPYLENPITATLYNKSDIRNQKLKEYNKEYDEINYQLMKNKLKSETETKKAFQIEGQKFCNHVQETFNKIQQQRYQFKKNCLEGKYVSAKKLMTEPDSLEKQYSIYLDQQIAEKRRRQDHNIFKSHLDDKIIDKNLISLNQNPEVQSSSPAYLGRIPYNFDRQKQLSYLNRQVNGHQRTKTEAALAPSRQTEEKPSPSMKFSNKDPQITVLQPILPSPEINFQAKSGKDYKYFNIITGNMAIRKDTGL